MSDLPPNLVAEARRVLELRGVVAVEGPNGVGKTTLLERLRVALPGFPVEAGPRPSEDERTALRAAEELQWRSEEFVVDLISERRPCFLDRGWVSIDIYRRIFARGGPSIDYEYVVWRGVPRLPSLVVFLDTSDATIDRSLFERGDEYLDRFSLLAERGAFRRAAMSYRGDAVLVRRTDEGGYLAETRIRRR